MIRRKNKQAPTHPWMIAGERVKQERLRKAVEAIAALRAKR
jgi:hypothetical protein